MGVMDKECFKCKEIKKVSEFYAHSAMGDGHLGKCKECTKLDVAKRYADPRSRARIRRYERRRFKDPNRKAKLKIYRRAMQAKRPGVWRTRGKVARALKTGKILRKPCEVCGETKVQAHHRDYRKPLDVMWLCFKHHREEHGQKVG